jgi:hypothetical protein
MNSWKIRSLAVLILLLAAALGCGESWEGKNIAENRSCATRLGDQYEKSACASGLYCESTNGRAFFKENVEFEMGTCTKQKQPGESCSADAACVAPARCVPDPAADPNQAIQTGIPGPKHCRS